MADDTNYRILVVDDEQDLCEILSFELETEGYKVDTANSVEESLHLDLTQYDLFMLDVMMEGMSGFDFAKILKKDPKTAQTPIIFLTAKDTENDTVKGLILGADDYIAKPFHIREVLLRIKAVLRRTNEKHDATKANLLIYEGLQLNLDNKTVTVEGQEVQFTKIEFEILYQLLKNRGRILSRDKLIETVWPRDVVVLNRTVDVNITRVRKKIGNYAKRIVTRIGFGYYFEE